MDIIPSTQIAVDVWEKRPDESAKAYAAFSAYMRLPPDNRSIQKALKTTYGTINVNKLRVWQRWCSAYSWVMRADAWDAEVYRTTRNEHIQAIKDMNDRAIKIAKGLQQKAIERLRQMDMAELSPDQIIRYVQVGISMERLALGQPTEIVQSSSMNMNLNVDFTNMSDEELREVLARRINP